LHGREEGVEATILTEKFRWHPEPGRANNHPVGGGCSSQNGVPRKALLSSQDIGWSSSEKKIARRAFDAALDTALAAIIAEFKRRAAAATTSDEMWDMEDYLRRQRRQIEETFDYRYSQLPFVFARLISAGYLDEAQLAGLSDDKLHEIRRSLAWMKKR
jgi:hypothetical protein